MNLKITFSELLPYPPEANELSEPAVIVLQVFVVISSTLNSLVAMLSLTFYTCICYGLYKEFEYFRYVNKKAVQVELMFAQRWDENSDVGPILAQPTLLS